MTKANIRILVELVVSFCTVKYGTTTKSLSRYTNINIRTIFRFLAESHDQIQFRVSIFKSLIFKEKQIHIAAIDEVVEGKSRNSNLSQPRR